MTAENFAYWLKGYFEIHGKDAQLSPEQLKMVKQHLDYVFQPPQIVVPKDRGAGIAGIMGGIGGLSVTC